MTVDQVIARLEAIRAEFGPDVAVVVCDGDAYIREWCLHAEHSREDGWECLLDTTGSQADYDRVLKAVEAEVGPCPFGWDSVDTSCD